MLFSTPELLDAEKSVLDQIEELKQQLRWQLHEPRRWFGSLRRLSFARAIQGSNSIEGYEAKLDDAAAVALGEPPLDADEETLLALEGYRDAMTYVLQLAGEPRFQYHAQLLKSLHFMMTGYSLRNQPGLWRNGTVYVRNEESGEIVYEGADVDQVPDLMQELADYLNYENGEPSIVKAGMAHLNLVMVHPFRDGNGRMARCLQSLVLARDGVLSPGFMSIEEYLGRNTLAYYNVLAEVGQGKWSPENDARSWIRFTLTAHLRQARTMLRRIRETEDLWQELERIAETHDLPDRAVVALFDAAVGFRVRNGVYRAAFAGGNEEISDQTASRDLRQMVDAKLLIPHGQKRGRFYVAANEVTAIRAKIVSARTSRDHSDPFAV